MAVYPTTLLSLCAGYGGIDLGVRLAIPGVRTVGAVERQAYAAAVLASRMAEGALDPCPIFDDLESFDGHAYRDRVDLVVAGFPCQGASVAGKRRGIEDARWLWPEVWRVAQETNCQWIFIENVPGLLSVNGGGAFESILRDLGSLGWAAEWDCVSAASVGAPHLRDRVFLLAADPGRVGVRIQPERGERGERTAKRRAAKPNDGSTVGAAANSDRVQRKTARWPNEPAQRTDTHRGDRSDAADAPGIGRHQGAPLDTGTRRARGPDARRGSQHGTAADARSTGPQRSRATGATADLASSDTDRSGCESIRHSRGQDTGEREAQRRDLDGRRGETDRNRILDLGRSHWDWGRAPEPCIRGLDDGAAGWMGDDTSYAEALHLLGNGVVPHAAACAFLTLFDRLHP